MSNIKIALLNISKNFKNEKELKSSFIISVIGMAINNLSFLILWYYFGKTLGELNGWKPMDVFGLYAFSTSSYGIVVAFFDGMLNIPKYISTGNFDKYLLTPKNILMKVSTSKISTSAFGDMLFGIICLIIFAIYHKFSFSTWLLAIFLIIITSIIMYSFSLVCMTISFYLMDGYNVSHGFYGMFLGNSMYHGGAFTGLLRIFFIFIIPSLLVGAVPVEIINNFSLNHLLLLILLTIFWTVFAIIFFYKSLRKYESNNLFGFGN